MELYADSYFRPENIMTKGQTPRIKSYIKFNIDFNILEIEGNETGLKSTLVTVGIIAITNSKDNTFAVKQQKT